MCVCVLNHIQLCDPMDCSPPGSSVHGILQARILEWIASSYSRGSSWPGIEPMFLASLALAGRFFTTAPPAMPSITVLLSNFRIYLLPLRETSYPSAATPHLPSTPLPWKPDLLSVSMDLPLLDIAYNGVIQWWSFVTGFFHLAQCRQGLCYGMYQFSSAQLLSRVPLFATPYFIPSYGQIILDYMAISTFCLSIRQLIDIWVVSPFWLLCILPLWTLMYKFLYGCVLISLGYISRCRITGSFVTVCLTLWGTGFCSKVGVYHRSRQQCLRVPASPALMSSVLFQLFCWACGGVALWFGLHLPND